MEGYDFDVGVAADAIGSRNNHDKQVVL